MLHLTFKLLLKWHSLQVRFGWYSLALLTIYAVISFSSYSTTHKKVGFDSRHVCIEVEGPDGSKTWKQRTLGVDTSVNHTAQLQFDNTIEIIGKMAKMFNESPLAKKRNISFTLEDFATKLIGTSGDHAADQIKTHKLLEDWKAGRVETKIQALVTAAMEKLDPNEFFATYMTALDKKINDVGGDLAWHGMTDADRSALSGEVLNETRRNIGLSELPEWERKNLTTFIRTLVTCG
jgi:hypothetical protein